MSEYTLNDILTPKQARFMYLVANYPKFAKKVKCSRVDALYYLLRDKEAKLELFGSPDQKKIQERKAKIKFLKKKGWKTSRKITLAKIS